MNKKILKYYEKKYKIKINFEIVKGFCLSRYYPDIRNIGQGDILISKEHIKNLDFKNRFAYKNLKEKLIFTLLHEICHAIQYQSQGDLFIDTYNIQSRLEHSSRNYEEKADIFARQELKKWIIKEV